MPRSIQTGIDGELIVWKDYRNGGPDLYAQRINGNGETQWDTGGVYIATTVTTSGGIYTTFTTVSDGRGGGIVTWIDGRSGNWDIYSQRISSEGEVKWASGGVAVCTDPEEQSNQVTVSDGEGGVIVAWVDGRPAGAGVSIYAQRVDSSGTLRWGGIEEEPWYMVLPREVKLEQNWPNPFNTKTIINYQLSIINSAPTTLKIYNILGQEVRTLVDGKQPPGYYSVRWDGRDNQGKEVSSGVYFCRLEVEGLKAESRKLKAERTRKMVLIR